MMTLDDEHVLLFNNSFILEIISVNFNNNIIRTVYNNPLMEYLIHDSRNRYNLATKYLSITTNEQLENDEQKLGNNTHYYVNNIRIATNGVKNKNYIFNNNEKINNFFHRNEYKSIYIEMQIDSMRRRSNGGKDIFSKKQDKLDFLSNFKLYEVHPNVYKSNCKNSYYVKTEKQYINTLLTFKDTCELGCDFEIIDTIYLSKNYKDIFINAFTIKNYKTAYKIIHKQNIYDYMLGKELEL